MEPSIHNARRSGVPTSPMSNPKRCLRIAMTEKSLQDIGRGPAETLQDVFYKDRVLWIFMNQEKNKDGAVAATQQSPIAVPDKTGISDQLLSSTHLSFIRQGMKTLEASLVNEVRTRTHEAKAFLPKESGKRCFRRRQPIRLIRQMDRSWRDSVIPIDGKARKRCKRSHDV